MPFVLEVTSYNGDREGSPRPLKRLNGRRSLSGTFAARSHVKTVEMNVEQTGVLSEMRPTNILELGGGP